MNILAQATAEHWKDFAIIALAVLSGLGVILSIIRGGKPVKTELINHFPTRLEHEELQRQTRDHYATLMALTDRVGHIEGRLKGKP